MARSGTPKKPKVQVLGGPGTRETVFITQAEPGEDAATASAEAAYELALEMGRDVLRRKGLAGQPGVEQVLEDFARKQATEWERAERMAGVDEGYVRLFAAPSKRDAVKIASVLTVTHSGFARLVFNSRSQLGYRHRMKWKEFVPRHLESVADEIPSALKGAVAGPASAELDKAMKRLSAVFSDRKRVHVHMFEKGAKWHAFFFDLNDVSDRKLGPHVHYVSHRWAGVRREDVWSAFDSRRQSIPRGVHIKYVDARAGARPPGRRERKGPRGRGWVLRVETWEDKAD